MQNWKIKIVHDGEIYRDEGLFEEVMARLQTACPCGKLIEAVRPKEEKVDHMLTELKRVEGKATACGVGMIAEMARDLRRHIQINGRVEMRDADALAYLVESMNSLEVA